MLREQFVWNTGISSRFAEQEASWPSHIITVTLTEQNHIEQLDGTLDPTENFGCCWTAASLHAQERTASHCRTSAKKTGTGISRYGASKRQG